ncbi:hypothetical protein ACMUMS_12525 [Acinetobacter courvalinii]|uniref:hypothetical protein n=1 Tax=Acinetobacter courvalinii TaxID=280147 RepID=UPI003A85F974
MKKIFALILSLTSSLSYAELQALDNETLQSIRGQGGADLSLKVSLNQNVLTDNALLTGTVPTFNCTNLEYCRLAVSVNKRFVQFQSGDSTDVWSLAASDPTSDNKARKLWLVFKGLQGTLNIQKIGLEGVDLNYTKYLNGAASALMIKPTMQFSFDPTKPIQIRDFGFNALSIEQDKVLSYFDASGKLIEETSSDPQDYGFLKTATYSVVQQSTGATGTTANNYDTNKETGFMGLKMNGNLAMEGKVQIFACSNHARC